jgi:hypothetical protein
MSNHTLELIPGVEGADGIRLDGTLYSAAHLASALRLAPRHRALVEAARAALAVADLGQAARSQLAPVARQPAIARLLGHITDAETAAWGALAEQLDSGL